MALNHTMQYNSLCKKCNHTYCVHVYQYKQHLTYRWYCWIHKIVYKIHNVIDCSTYWHLCTNIDLYSFRHRIMYRSIDSCLQFFALYHLQDLWNSTYHSLQKKPLLWGKTTFQPQTGISKVKLDSKTILGSETGCTYHR